MIIAGDIGGTKTNLALFENDCSNYKFFKTYPSQQYGNLTLILEEFLKDLGPLKKEIKKACFAIAGPVREGICYATNLPWIVDSKEIEAKTKIPKVFLINDLEANAYALSVLTKESLSVVYPGEKINGNQGVISPGTGLGEAGIYQGKYPFASEGGHCDFAPVNPLQIELLQYLSKKFDHVSYERILSGQGFLNLYDFFCVALKKEDKINLKTPADITTHALNGTSDLANEILDLFLEILGQEAGNLALKTMAFGGIYIGGGICPKIAQAFNRKAFLQGYLNKGRFKSFLEKIPVNLIMDDKASLKGSAFFALKT